MNAHDKATPDMWADVRLSEDARQLAAYVWNLSPNQWTLLSEWGTSCFPAMGSVLGMPVKRIEKAFCDLRFAGYFFGFPRKKAVPPPAPHPRRARWGRLLDSRTRPCGQSNQKRKIEEQTT